MYETNDYLLGGLVGQLPEQYSMVSTLSVVRFQ